MIGAGFQIERTDRVACRCQSLWKVAEALRAPMPRERLARLLTTSAHGLGFDCFLYMSFAASSACRDDRPIHLLSDLPAAEVQFAWPDRHHLDSVVALARRASEAFAWNARDLCVDHPDTADQDQARLRHGITAPAQAPRGGLCLLTFAASREDLDPRGILPHVGAMLTVFCASIASWLEASDAPSADAVKVRLSTRERECLSWTARGKTSWEIARIIGRSEDTVNFHLKRAFGKLNAANKCHAVAIALSQGQIRWTVARTPVESRISAGKVA